MSVIVENMDLPSGCLDCRYFQGAGSACIALKYHRITIDDIHERPKNCPLRPLSNARPALEDIAKMMKDDLEKDDSVINTCPWCNDKKLYWVIYDKQIESAVSDKLIHYCFRCGRKLK